VAPGADVVARATAALSLALAIGAVAGIAPARAQACEPPGFGARGRAEGDGVTIVYRTVPAAVEWGRHFAVEAIVCADGPAAVLSRVDADMPEHRHGMNYRPSLTATSSGHYVAEGLLFHMPGRWRLWFDVERGGRRTRLASDVLVD
jgi:hypothetical protein